ncbi:MAG: UvrD-helicase domain-containing protein [Steroidobacteraceae bacterium]
MVRTDAVAGATAHDADAVARVDSLDPTRSILLQAPAGSGKTTILTQRVLRLLADVEAPEQILAITFTRKAAAEMRERIVAALRGDRPPKNATERLTAELAARARAHGAQRGWNLAEHPARLRVQTIDGLNRWLAANRPVASATGAALEISADADRLYREAARRTLLDAESDVQLGLHSGRLLERLDNRWERLEALLVDMLRRRGQWLRHLASGDGRDVRERVAASLRRLLGGALARAARQVPRELLRTGVELAAHASRTLAARGNAELAAALAAVPRDGEVPGPDPEDLAAWKSVAQLALTAKFKLRAGLNAKQGIEAADKPVYARANRWLRELESDPVVAEELALVARLPPLAYEDHDAAALDSLVELLRQSAAQLELLFRDVGQVDYPAVAAAARAALGDASGPSDLAIFQGERLHHLLIDEFQDTSIDQFELLATLVRDWQPGDGRTLFIVGDPMQSIYQFRQAEVALFLQAREQGVGPVHLESLALTRNFRSAAPIIEFVNETFAAVFPHADEPLDGAVRYLACTAAREPEPGREPGVTLHNLPADGGASEARRVVEIVQQLRERNADATIAVLVAARDHAALLSRALREHGVGVQGVDLVPLGDVPLVQDLIALTRALASPADRIAWLALLRAPWCGLDLAALTRLVAADATLEIPSLLQDEARLAQLEPADRARLERFAARIHEPSQESRQAGIAARVEAAWLRLGGPSTCAREADLADARRYLDALAERDRQGELEGPEDLPLMVRDLYAAGDAGEGGAVQVLTIHRAKGLEFDAVILPGLQRSPRADQEPLLDWFEWPGADGSDELVLAPVRAPDADARSPLGQWIHDCRRRRRERERARVLYVATTRARHWLHLLGAVVEPQDGRPRAPVAGTPLATLWPALGGDFPVMAAVATPGGGASAGDSLAAAGAPAGGAAAGIAPPATLSVDPRQLLRRFAADWTPATPPAGVRVQGLRVSSVELAELPAYVWVGDTARHVGTVVHAEFERFVREGAIDAVPRIEAARARYASLLRGEGVAADELAAAVGRVVEALRRAVEDPLGRWILSRHAADDHVELELTGLHEGRLASGIVDRCFLADDGQRWIIDYKTSAHEGGGVEEFLASESRRYAPQLRRYAALARALGPQPLRAALYFPLLSRLVEVRLD